MTTSVSTIVTHMCTAAERGLDAVAARRSFKSSNNSEEWSVTTTRSGDRAGVLVSCGTEDALLAFAMRMQESNYSVTNAGEDCLFVQR